MKRLTACVSFSRSSTISRTFDLIRVNAAARVLLMKNTVAVRNLDSSSAACAAATSSADSRAISLHTRTALESAFPFAKDTSSRAVSRAFSIQVRKYENVV